MILNILNNDYFKIILVFLLGIIFLLLFTYFASITEKIANKKKKSTIDNEKVSRQARIYELIFNNNSYDKEEFKKHFNCEFSVIEEDLNEMCENKILLEKDGKYYINK